MNNNGGTADGLNRTAIANAKYNGVKAITHFIHAGDRSSPTTMKTTT
ncbi:MAG: hypothetical protein ACLS6O_01475 [Bifidobacterium sp.]